MTWFHDQLKSRWLVEVRGILGPPGMDRTVQEMLHLNRIILWDQHGITWEPDPRHAELLCRDVGVSSNSVTTPLVKEKVEALDFPDVLLEESKATEYRSHTMRAGYLAQDRTDLQRAVRELAKGMSQPTERHQGLLKRVARYLCYAPRVIIRWRYQDKLTMLDTYCDTDHAGCIRTRKSTTGVVKMLGRNLLHSLCRGQAVIALSSGEAEYYGLVTGASEGLGDVSMAKDFGVQLKLRVFMDATAGAAIGSRRGLGRVKHIDTVFLWVQEAVGSGRFTIARKHTSENLADILTKAVDQNLLGKFMRVMGFEFLSGKAALAYRA